MKLKRHRTEHPLSEKNPIFSLMKKVLKTSFFNMRLICPSLSLVLFSPPLQSQRKSFEKKPSGPGAMIKESDIDYQLWEGFLLVRKANAGEPAAQHELGIRYLQGKGFAADTVKAVFWFMKAADQDFDLANYNLGILAMNGWGMQWNPFQSYASFLRAAKKRSEE